MMEGGMGLAVDRHQSSALDTRSRSLSDHTFENNTLINTPRASALRRRPWCALQMGALITLPLAAQPNAEPIPGNYRVAQGEVDRGTYTD